MSRSGRRGVTLIELLISAGIFSFLTMAVFGVFKLGYGQWHVLQDRDAIQSPVRRVLDNMVLEVRGACYKTVQVLDNPNGTPGQEAVCFQTSWDPATSSYQTTDDGRPKWMGYVIYFAHRPDGLCTLADGSLDIDECPPGTPGDSCPHKFLVRKYVPMPAPIQGQAIAMSSSDFNNYMSKVTTVGSETEVKMLATDVVRFRISMGNSGSYAPMVVMTIKGGRGGAYQRVSNNQDPGQDPKSENIESVQVQSAVTLRNGDGL